MSLGFEKYQNDVLWKCLFIRLNCSIFLLAGYQFIQAMHLDEF